MSSRRKTGVECVYRHTAKETRMTAIAWNWLLAIVGTLASVAGVVFSAMAWRQATKAKDAAREAADGIHKRNTAQEALRLAGEAKAFLAAVQQNRAENASSTGTSLVHLLAMFRARSITRSADVDVLGNCESEIIKVIVGLNADGIPVDQSNFSDLLDRCHAIHRTICEMAGRMERLSEGEDG